ncbi:MAG: hypothetical protein SCARUB_00468 [Candidatus Scalindua rubra]|uniref:CBS domain-containing protein n=1 Tax=Candidatus Scalindua rubra TaxID=1872076 RepID=A0A1E3XFC7_9BACT|nr:MAG: hypothetical protein SCARUB_00468 [Candidatus Scalindua rubra]
MTVDSIMSRKVITVKMDDSLHTICDIFKRFGFHHTLIVESRNLVVGVISDRDLLGAISPFLNTLSEKTCDTNTLNMKAHHIMGLVIVTINTEDSIETTTSLLLRNNISCLPVLSPQGVVEGIVTWKDIVNFHLKNKTVTV